MKNDEQSGYARNFSQLPYSVTVSGTRFLHRNDVILALMEVGLGAKLVNEVIQKLGFPLDQFPSQNAELANKAATARWWNHKKGES